MPDVLLFRIRKYIACINQFVNQAQTFHSTRRLRMPVPDRWDAYSPLGRVICGTNLLAFKVPLKEALLENVPTDDWFTPSILIEQAKDSGINLGLVIDLTFTKKYYCPTEFTSQEILYKKIYTKGQQVPSDNVYTEFATAIKEFAKKDHMIGVHCTHGLNRTGYLICRYMIEELKFKPQAAIKLFGEARGHEMERENYLQDLHNRVPGEITIVEEGEHQQEDPEQTVWGRNKPRWRHNRDDHIGWRNGNSHKDYNDTNTHRFQGEEDRRTDHDGWGYQRGNFRTGSRERGNYSENQGRRHHHNQGDHALEENTAGYQYQSGGYHQSRNYDYDSRNQSRGHHNRDYGGSGYHGRGYHHHTYQSNGYEEERNAGYQQNRGGNHRWNQGSRIQGRGAFNTRNEGFDRPTPNSNDSRTSYTGNEKSERYTGAWGSHSSSQGKSNFSQRTHDKGGYGDSRSNRKRTTSSQDNHHS